MADTDKQEKEAPVASNLPVRESMVNTAVNFLQNTKVQSSPLSQKRAFLLKKGLNEKEIDLAFQRADNVNNVPSQFQHPHSAIVPVPQAMYLQEKHSFWTLAHRYSSTVVIIGVAVYGLHQLYKMYIESWLFGTHAKEDRMVQFENQLLELNRSLSQLKRSVTSIEEALNVQKEQLNKSITERNREFQDAISPSFFIELKADVATVKSLLLNRHQFPDVPKVNRSIPEWQLINGASGKFSEGEDDVELVDTETAGKQNKEAKENAELERETNEDIQNEKLSVVETVEQVGTQEEPISLSASTDSFEHCSSTA